MLNFFAIFTIVKFRIKEFTNEYHYSILAPLTSNLLFVIIFSTIDRFYSLSNDNISFIEFLIPGLIIMVVAQESFDNPSVSMINSKQIGSFDDFLVAPLSRVEIFVAYLISQIFIGLFIAIINFLILSYFISYNYFSIFNITLLAYKKTFIYNHFFICGHSSVVERLVANEKVEGSSPFARSSKSNE